jgi:hypothetical protein
MDRAADAGLRRALLVVFAIGRERRRLRRRELFCAATQTAFWFVCPPALHNRAQICIRRLLLMLALTLLALQDVRYTQPSSFFTYAVLLLVVLGIVGWLVAVILGFGRIKRFGPAARWFVLSALCVLLFHVHLIVFVVITAVMAAKGGDIAPALKFGFFFNLFIVLGAIFAIMGFNEMKNPAVIAPAKPETGAAG